MPAPSDDAQSLRSHTRKQLAQLAKSAGVLGWHGMRKEELIAALTAVQRTAVEPRNSRRGGGPARDRAKTDSKRPPRPAQKASPRAAVAPPTRVQRKLAELHRKRQLLRDISTAAAGDGADDRLLLVVRDPYWLHLVWEISPQSVRRAQTALGQAWHAAEPMIRLHRLHPSGASGGFATVVIHGGVNHWYVNVNDPPGDYRAEIGYGVARGQFYALAKSSEATTPSPTAAAPADDNWRDVARNADHIYAMNGGYSDGGVSTELQEALESRLQRRLGRPTDTRLGQKPENAGAQPLLGVQAEMVVHGQTEPHTHLTVRGEMVEVGDDGAFEVRLAMPDRRQVIPVVATSADGARQDTVIIGVDKNTKALAPRNREAGSA